MSRALPPLALTAAVAAAGAPLLLASPAAAASPGTYDITAELTPLNDSGARATVRGTLEGTTLHLTITPEGLLEDAPHAQHLHIGGRSTCPPADATGSGVDGALRPTDAAPDYGEVAVSLTTTGDTGVDSALAVDRFPVGDATYERTVEVPEAVAAGIVDGQVPLVQHGVDLNDSGTYDGTSMSDLDPTLPEEVTDPATCGVLQASMAMPSGGVATGVGGAAGTGTDLGLIGAGLGLVALGAGAYGIRRVAVARRA